MRILYIVNTLHSLGNPNTVPFINDQIDSIEKFGHDVTILNIQGNESRLNYFKAILPLRELIRAKKFDLIHGHYSYSGCVAIFQRTLPVIVSFMGSDLYGSFKANGTNTIRGFIDIWLSRFLQLFVNGIIVKSKEMQQLLIRKEKSIVLPNGVDFEIFKPMNRDDCLEKLGLNKTKKYVLFIGNPNNPRKGYATATKAIKILSSEYDNVELLEVYRVPHKDIPYYMNAANVLILPSIKEGSPNVVKEAMACNLPIVATDVGDVKEVIDGVDGCAIVNRDPPSFASAIENILDFKDRTGGRDHIGYLRMEKIADRLVGFYEKILSPASR